MLRAIRSGGRDAFLSDEAAQDRAERHAQLLAQACTDITLHFFGRRLLHVDHARQRTANRSGVEAQPSAVQRRAQDEGIATEELSGVGQHTAPHLLGWKGRDDVPCGVEQGVPSARERGRVRGVPAEVERPDLGRRVATAAGRLPRIAWGLNPGSFPLAAHAR